jgi:hypothetical protein
MLQAGRSRVRFPMRSLDLIGLILPAPKPTQGCSPEEEESFQPHCGSGSTQRLTEMSTRNLPGGNGWSAREARGLSAIHEPIVYKMWEP